MEPIKISSCEDFEEFCFRTFECFLQGDLFPYSLRDTYHLAFSSWDEAVKELLEDGVEGFTYQKSQNGDDYQLCMQAFVHHVLLQDKELRYLACFCNNTYKMLVNTFDIPLRYDTQCVKGDDGRMKIIQVPVNGYQPKMQDPRYSGFMEANGDIVAKVCFDKFLQRSGFSESTAAIAEAFGMPEEGLLCILKQNGVIVQCNEDDAYDEDKCSWELSEEFRDKGYTRIRTNADGKQEIRWTYIGFFFIWLLLTKDCKVRPCYERSSHEVRE